MRYIFSSLIFLMAVSSGLYPAICFSQQNPEIAVINANDNDDKGNDKDDDGGFNGDPIIINQQSNLIIPTFVLPSSGTSTLEITTSGAVGPSTNIELLSQNQQSGRLQISTEKQGDYTINITNVTVPSGVTVTGYTISWDGKLVTTGVPFTQKILKNKNYTMLIGIKLAISSNVAPGPIAIGYRVDIN